MVAFASTHSAGPMGGSTLPRQGLMQAINGGTEEDSVVSEVEGQGLLHGGILGFRQDETCCGEGLLVGPAIAPMATVDRNQQLAFAGPGIENPPGDVTRADLIVATLQHNDGNSRQPLVEPHLQGPFPAFAAAHHLGFDECTPNLFILFGEHIDRRRVHWLKLAEQGLTRNPALRCLHCFCVTIGLDQRPAASAIPDGSVQAAGRKPSRHGLAEAVLKAGQPASVAVLAKVGRDFPTGVGPYAANHKAAHHGGVPLRKQ